MTVCVASYCDEGPCIIAASDHRVSAGGWVSADSLVKDKSIATGWRAMYAGNDITPAAPIVKRVQRALMGMPNPPRAMRDQVVSAFIQSYEQELHASIRAKILGRYGISAQDWFDHGLVKFGEKEHARINHLIEQVTLQVEFLVFGFDSDAHLFNVNNPQNPGAVEDRDEFRFWAIGSGAYLALASMMSSTASTLSLEQTLWSVCEAKFAAEKADAVGADTMVVFLYKDGTEKFLFSPPLDPIRKAWEIHSSTPVPRDVLYAIRAVLPQAKTLPELELQAGITPPSAPKT